MPCNCDHMEPNKHEIESKKACQCARYLLRTMNLDVPDWVEEGAEDYYGIPFKMEEVTILLCKLCSEIDDSIIYNGRDKEARMTADWWDEHQKADRERIAKEEHERKQNTLRASAAKKLTDEEKDALGI